MKTYFNTHCHFLIFRDIPEYFLPYNLVRFLIKYRLTKWLAWILHNLNPFTKRDIFDRYSSFLKDGDKSSPELIFKALNDVYSENWKFVPLTVDFDFMGCGNAMHNFEKQIELVSNLKMNYPDKIYPFLAIDPRRENLLDLVKKNIERKIFSGLKMYPSLGFWPMDSRLYPIYEYAQEKQIPITVHCSRGGIFTRKKIEARDLIHPVSGKVLRRTKNSNFANLYTNPENYYYVLKDFPELKINFAHFGGWTDCEEYFEKSYKTPEQNWTYIVIKLLKDYPNTFSDISYTLTLKRLIYNLKNEIQLPEIQNKILFGTDYYMNAIETSENWCFNDIPKIFGQTLMDKIANENPKRFLNLP